MATGRPTKYSKAMQAKADAYVDGDHVKNGDVVPSIVGLAVYLGVSKPTLLHWRDTRPVFLTTFERCKMQQERLVTSGGLAGEMNPTISKLLLHQHGLTDRVEQDNTSSDGSMSPQVNVYVPDNGRDS